MKQKDYKTITCVVIDDDLIQISFLKQLIKNCKELTLVQTFSNPQKAFEFLEESNIDIAFVDIQMDGMDGITLAKNLTKKTIPIFVSGSDQYALDAFSVDAVDYLLKPITQEKFNNAVKKATELHLGKQQQLLSDSEKTGDDSYLNVVFKRKSYKVEINNLKYIEAKKEYILFHTTSNTLTCLEALKNIEQVLDETVFIKVHRSYIINKKFITSYSRSTVTINNDLTINIGRIYKESFKTFCDQYLSGNNQ